MRQEGMHDLKKDLKTGQSSDEINRLGKQASTNPDRQVRKGSGRCAQVQDEGDHFVINMATSTVFNGILSSNG
ncbi:hypothetical protein BC937DRAFT_94100, partial [Endogone sp. FLAS-F59071]